MSDIPFSESAAGLQQHVQLTGGIAVVFVFVAAGDEHGVLAAVAVSDVGIDPALVGLIRGVAQLGADIARGAGSPGPCVIGEYAGALVGADLVQAHYVPFTIPVQLHGYAGGIEFAAAGAAAALAPALSY